MNTHITVFWNSDRVGIMLLCKHLSPFIMEMEPHESSSSAYISSCSIYIYGFWDFCFHFERTITYYVQRILHVFHLHSLNYESIESRTISAATFPIIGFMFHRMLLHLWSILIKEKIRSDINGSLPLWSCLCFRFHRIKG